MGDIIIIVLLVCLIIVCCLLLKELEDRKKKIKMLGKSERDMADLTQITKNIEETYQPITVKLTNYEQEQEDNAIISYDELVKNSHNNISYEKEYKSESNINVKKIDLENGSIGEGEHRIGVSLMSYEAEESFLRALKQLQSNLIR